MAKKRQEREMGRWVVSIALIVLSFSTEAILGVSHLGENNRTIERASHAEKRLAGARRGETRR